MLSKPERVFITIWNFSLGTRVSFLTILKILVKYIYVTNKIICFYLKKRYPVKACCTLMSAIESAVLSIKICSSLTCF